MRCDRCGGRSFLIEFGYFAVEVDNGEAQIHFDRPKIICNVCGVEVKPELRRRKEVQLEFEVEEEDGKD